MRHYTLTVPKHEDRKRFFADAHSLGNYNFHDFWKWTPISVWDSQYFVQSTQAVNDGPPDDIVLNASLLFIASPRLQHAISAASISGLQFLPIRLRYSNNEEIAGYSIVNILESLHAIDKERSECRVRKERDGPEVITSIREPFLIEDVTKNVHIFRLKEYPAPVFVSDDFKKLFEDAGCTGGGFLEARPGRSI